MTTYFLKTSVVATYDLSFPRSHLDMLTLSGIGTDFFLDSNTFIMHGGVGKAKTLESTARIVNNCHVVSLSVTDCVHLSATHFNSAKETKLKLSFGVLDDSPHHASIMTSQNKPIYSSIDMKTLLCVIFFGTSAMSSDKVFKKISLHIAFTSIIIPQSHIVVFKE